jgi:hypothetical protein
MSLGTVNKLRLEASSAVVSGVEIAKSYIQLQKVCGADETSFKYGVIVGNTDKLLVKRCSLFILYLSIIHKLKVN